MSLLVPTKIYFTSSRPRAAATVARDWWVVLVPDNNNTLDVIGLYNAISSHAFDEQKLFAAIEGDDHSVRAQVGRLETGSSQNIPLSVKVADAAQVLEIYFKFFVTGGEDCSGEDSGTPSPRDACKVKANLF